MRYVCDYLGFKEIGYSSIAIISGFLDRITVSTSQEYIEFEDYLTNRNQSSYLVKGFVKAEGKHFLFFIRKLSFIKKMLVPTDLIDDVIMEEDDEEYQLAIDMQSSIINDFSFEYKKAPEYIETTKDAKTV